MEAEKRPFVVLQSFEVMKRPSSPVLTTHIHTRISGYSLLEISLVILVVCMLAGAMIVFLLPQREGAEWVTTRNTLAEVEAALGRYKEHVGTYPTEAQGLQALLIRPTFEDSESTEAKSAEKWAGPYLTSDASLRDAWTQPLRYELTGMTTARGPGASGYRLYSVGPDGRPKTDDDVRLSESAQD